MSKIKTAPPRLRTADSRRVRPEPKRADPHYLTPEHRQWRLRVIARAGGRCETCGRREERMFADHIVELRDGGAAFEPRNGQCLCGSCHTKKTAVARLRRLMR